MKIGSLVCWGSCAIALTAIPLDLEGQVQNDSVSVAQTVRAFHEFMAEGDSASVLGLLSADVVILESGNVEDRDHYRSGHFLADMRFARAVNQQRSDIRVVVTGDAAWATSTASMTGEYRGQSVNSTSAELMVLSRVDGQWKIRAIHWSSRRAG